MKNCIKAGVWILSFFAILFSFFYDGIVFLIAGIAGLILFTIFTIVNAKNILKDFNR